MRPSLALIGFLALLSACSLYRNGFDCAPGRGMPCSSVSQIEAQVIETTQGPDIFLSSGQGDLGVLSLMGSGIRNQCLPKRIWVAPRIRENGLIQHAYYVEQVKRS
jgi:hypothetical protein